MAASMRPSLPQPARSLASTNYQSIPSAQLASPNWYNYVPTPGPYSTPHYQYQHSYDSYSNSYGYNRFFPPPYQYSGAAYTLTSTSYEEPLPAHKRSSHDIDDEARPTAKRAHLIDPSSNVNISPVIYSGSVQQGSNDMPKLDLNDGQSDDDSSLSSSPGRGGAGGDNFPSSSDHLHQSSNSSSSFAMSSSIVSS